MSSSHEAYTNHFFHHPGFASIASAKSSGRFAALSNIEVSTISYPMTCLADRRIRLFVAAKWVAGKASAFWR